MPARSKKSEEKPAWVVEEVTAPEVKVEDPVVETHDAFVERVVEEKKPEEPKIPMLLDIDAKTNPFANLSLIIGVIAAFIVGAVVGAAGMKLYESKSTTGEVAMKQETPTPTVTVAPTPTTKPAERAQISVAVLNGSGKTGAASKMATYLEALGYKIQRTGNATKDVAGPSEVHVNGDNSELGRQVAKDLEAEYKVNSEIMSKYDSSAASVVVVVGSE